MDTRKILEFKFMKKYFPKMQVMMDLSDNILHLSGHGQKKARR